MARLPRLYVEGVSLHVIQRGNNRSVCFYCDADYAFYLQQLKESSERYQVKVHSFVLMTNHVHLLVTPSTQYGVSKMMQALGRSYVRYINIAYKRSGTLWEGRFKASLVSSDHYFLNVSRYIELNPVRAKMVRLPGEYPWSSFRHNGMGVKIGLISEHETYKQLGRSDPARLLSYRALFDTELPLSLIDEIRLCANKEWVVGSECFKKQIETACERKINGREWGGDRKSSSFQKNQVALTP